MILAQASAITSEMTTCIELDKFDRFGEDFSDGRLVELNNDKPFDLRKAVSLSEKLGRPLSEQEIKQFEL